MKRSRRLNCGERAGFGLASEEIHFYGILAVVNLVFDRTTKCFVGEIEKPEPRSTGTKHNNNCTIMWFTHFCSIFEPVEIATHETRKYSVRSTTIMIDKKKSS